MSFSDELYNDLREVHDSVLRQLGDAARYISRKGLMRRIVSHPAKCFYVTAEEALKKYAKYKQTGELRCRNKECREKYLEVFSRFEQKMHEYYDFRKLDVMYMVVSSPAPKFYIKHETARIILNRNIKKK
jgi:hypothetical protein